MNIFATELPNFIRKYYLSHELLIFKYWQNISVSNISITYCSQALRQDNALEVFYENALYKFTFDIDNAPAYRARETEHLLTHETPDFITPALWPANSPDPQPSRLPNLAEAAGACVS